ncbi:MAG TPA: hypothetical protein DCO77_06995 [Nitrospiraceae bacterium]|nr:hypothetical protein [Nitrospiraceae bacterium]
MSKHVTISLLALMYVLPVFTTVCSSDGSSDPGIPITVCTSTLDDSAQNGDGTATLIDSSQNGTRTYAIITLARRTTINGVITMDYMVHEPTSAPTALLVLIAGGQLDAGIVGAGSTLAAAGGNFLVRSAHLFAAQGYRVLTVDRPSDYTFYTGGSTSGYAYDGYRTSMAHAVDLSEVINIANSSDNLPVIVVGTSRGAISAVAQHSLGTAIAISSSVTAGANGTPVGTGNVQPENVAAPAHVLWHVRDECSVTPPSGSGSLLSDFPDASGARLDGGFNDVTQSNPCKANTYHGFLGIESCAVRKTTNWLDGALTSLATTRPIANTTTSSTNVNAAVNVNLNGVAAAAAGGALTYSLPHTTTSLGGTVAISGTTVTYAPPTGVSGTTDTFVYVVSEAGGGVGHNVVSVTISP